jgi:polysaccharide pyruvyl transferase WcaK-like protein
MTKILILNVGWTNKGNCALVHSTMETIKCFIPNAEFVLMGVEVGSKNGFQIKKQIASGLHIRRPLTVFIPLLCIFKCAFVHISKKFNVHIAISKKSRLFEYYNTDIVINSGGDQTSGEHGFGVSTFMNSIYALLLDKPVVLYGESLGYFSNHIFNSIAKFVLNRTTLILLRENISKKYLDDNHITKPKIYVTADPAFLLKASPQSHVFDILSKEGIDEIRKPLIGINPSGLINKLLGEEKTTNTMARVIDNLVENLNATIIMIPHVYTSNGDDRIAINSVFHKVKNKSKVKTIKNEYAPQELKGIIGQCDLFIGARMHATIAATSMLVPTVGIAYSHKMHGIIGEMLGQQKYILDIKELNYENLISTINDAWENREKIKKELEVKIPEIKEKAMLNGKLVKELLDSLNNPK